MIDPTLYDAVHRGNPGDLSFYRKVCAGAGSVLELGCGSGRVLKALSDDGLRVTGVDHSRELLALASRRVPDADLKLADMTEVEFDRRFSRVIAPFNGLYCLADTAALRELFARVAGFLEPDGVFAFDVWNADEFHDDVLLEDEASDDGQVDDPDESSLLEPSLLVRVEVDGIEWHVFEQSEWNRERRTVTATYIHRSVDVHRSAGREVTYRIEHRYFLSEELMSVLRDAGFVVSEMRGGFADEAWSAESDVTTIVARPDSIRI